MSSESPMIDILGKPVKRIGVIGSGQIGPDIALHFSKVFSPADVPVVVVDISEDALERGRSKLNKKVDRGVESGAFRSEQGEKMKNGVVFTSDYSQLAGCDLVVEAATEGGAAAAGIALEARAVERRRVLAEARASVALAKSIAGLVAVAEADSEGAAAYEKWMAGRVWS